MSKNVDVYSMLDGWIIDRIAEDIAEALARNGYDVSAVSWDILCTVHDINEDLWICQIIWIWQPINKMM